MFEAKRCYFGIFSFIFHIFCGIILENFNGNSNESLTVPEYKFSM